MYNAGKTFVLDKSTMPQTHDKPVPMPHNKDFPFVKESNLLIFSLIPSGIEAEDVFPVYLAKKGTFSLFNDREAAIELITALFD